MLASLTRYHYKEGPWRLKVLTTLQEGVTHSSQVIVICGRDLVVKDSKMKWCANSVMGDVFSNHPQEELIGQHTGTITIAHFTGSYSCE
jgi:hypothetical protein